LWCTTEAQRHGEEPKSKPGGTELAEGTELRSSGVSASQRLRFARFGLLVHNGVESWQV